MKHSKFLKTAMLAKWSFVALSFFTFTALICLILIMVGCVHTSLSPYDTPFINQIKNIMFALASGVTAALFFTFFAVTLPKRREQKKTYKYVLHLPAFFLEPIAGFQHNQYENFLHADIKKCTVEEIIKYQRMIDSQKITTPILKKLYQLAEQIHPLFETHTSIVHTISSEHALCWAAMTHSLQQLKIIFEQNSWDIEEEEIELVEDYPLFLNPFLEALKVFIERPI